MNPRLTIVFVAFVTLIASASALAADVDRDPGKLRLASVNAVVIDASSHRSVYAKGADNVTPIASLNKQMTAIVTLDAQLPMDESIAIDMEDFDYLKGSHSRLRMRDAPRARCCDSR
jgi:D-alanyl-D-alanine endopeptidase (penicillin-binding protein 7)